MKELVIKKCLKCGAMVEVLQDCTCENCGIKCCGEEMKKLESNTGAAEKDILQYEIVENEIIVKVNHGKEEEDNIEWIAMASDEKIGKKFIKPNENATVIFPYVKGSSVYAYCNKHGLWKTTIE